MNDNNNGNVTRKDSLTPSVSVAAGDLTLKERKHGNCIKNSKCDIKMEQQHHKTTTNYHHSSTINKDFSHAHKSFTTEDISNNNSNIILSPSSSLNRSSATHQRHFFKSSSSSRNSKGRSYSNAFSLRLPSTRTPLQHPCNTHHEQGHHYQGKQQQRHRSQFRVPKSSSSICLESGSSRSGFKRSGNGAEGSMPGSMPDIRSRHGGVGTNLAPSLSISSFKSFNSSQSSLLSLYWGISSSRHTLNGSHNSSMGSFILEASRRRKRRGSIAPVVGHGGLHNATFEFTMQPGAGVFSSMTPPQCESSSPFTKLIAPESLNTINLFKEQQQQAQQLLRQHDHSTMPPPVGITSGSNNPDNESMVSWNSGGAISCSNGENDSIMSYFSHISARSGISGNTSNSFIKVEDWGEKNTGGYYNKGALIEMLNLPPSNESNMLSSSLSFDSVSGGVVGGCGTANNDTGGRNGRVNSNPNRRCADCRVPLMQLGNICASFHNNNVTSSKIPLCVTTNSNDNKMETHHINRINSSSMEEMHSHGVFICSACSLAHRSLGSKITRVKSVKIGVWNEKEICAMLDNGGNERNWRIWERYLNRDHESNGGKWKRWRLDKMSSPEDRELFVRAKYELKAFMFPLSPLPMTVTTSTPVVAECTNLSNNEPTVLIDGANDGTEPEVNLHKKHKVSSPKWSELLREADIQCHQPTCDEMLLVSNKQQHSSSSSALNGDENSTTYPTTASSPDLVMQEEEPNNNELNEGQVLLPSRLIDCFCIVGPDGHLETNNTMITLDPPSLSYANHDHQNDLLAMNDGDGEDSNNNNSDGHEEQEGPYSKSSKPLFQDLSCTTGPEQVLLSTKIIDSFSIHHQATNIDNMNEEGVASAAAALDYTHLPTEFPDILKRICFPNGCTPRLFENFPTYHSFSLPPTTGKDDNNPLPYYGAAMHIYDTNVDTRMLYKMTKKSRYDGQMPAWLMKVGALNRVGGMILPQPSSIYSSRAAEKAIPQRVYLPRCLVLLSRYPIFSSLRSMLTQLYRISLSDAPLPLERYVSNLVGEIPLPPPSLLPKTHFPKGKEQQVQQICAVGFRFTNEAYTLLTRHPELSPASCGIHLPFLDVSLRPLFTTLSVPNIMVIIGCLLHEQGCSVAICSSHKSLLNPIIHSLKGLLHPLIWQGLCLPIVPSGAIATKLLIKEGNRYLATTKEEDSSAMPFLIGLHSNYLKQVKPQDRPKGVVFVDVDSDTIQLGFEETIDKTTTKKSNGGNHDDAEKQQWRRTWIDKKIPTLPVHEASILRNALQSNCGNVYVPPNPSDSTISTENFATKIVTNECGNITTGISRVFQNKDLDFPEYAKRNNLITDNNVDSGDKTIKRHPTRIITRRSDILSSVNLAYPNNEHLSFIGSSGGIPLKNDESTSRKQDGDSNNLHDKEEERWMVRCRVEAEPMVTNITPVSSSSLLSPKRRSGNNNSGLTSQYHLFDKNGDEKNGFSAIGIRLAFLQFISSLLQNTETTSLPMETEDVDKSSHIKNNETGKNNSDMKYTFDEGWKTWQQQNFTAYDSSKCHCDPIVMSSISDGECTFLNRMLQSKMVERFRMDNNNNNNTIQHHEPCFESDNKHNHHEHLNSSTEGTNLSLDYIPSGRQNQELTNSTDEGMFDNNTDNPVIIHKAQPPSHDGIPNNGRLYYYRSFPKLSHELFGYIRPPKQPWAQAKHQQTQQKEVYTESLYANKIKQQLGCLFTIKQKSKKRNISSSDRANPSSRELCNEHNSINNSNSNAGDNSLIMAFQELPNSSILNLTEQLVESALMSVTCGDSVGTIHKKCEEVTNSSATPNSLEKVRFTDGRNSSISTSNVRNCNNNAISFAQNILSLVRRKQNRLLYILCKAQALYRMYIVRKQFRIIVAVVVIIQRVGRRYLLLTGKGSVSGPDFVIAVIQRAWRRRIVMKKFQFIVRSVVVMQRLVRVSLMSSGQGVQNMDTDTAT
mmetsp:Transcript_51658/g.62246  ORF Transcript_51658/g.62246 Transcript_51658/m.62246 type:complete len:1962 (+) Transcript_51658:314-6199(+)